MLKFLLLCINLYTASTNLNQINRVRRQSPFDGVEPSFSKYEPRETLSTNAHLKSEA
jgi:hypothetical protein